MKNLFIYIKTISVLCAQKVYIKPSEIFFIILIMLLFSACKKEQKEKTPILPTSGFFIINEGNFTWGNSSLSFYDEQKQSVENNIFYRANGVTLGDVAMEMKIIHNKGFIVVNNSGLIYIIDPSTSKHQATISGLSSPRHILPVNDSLAYVSDLYSPYITIINTYSLQKTGTIYVGKSTESFARSQNKVFVSSWSFNSKLYAIDVTSHQVIDSISIGKQPNSMITDKDGNIWVLCDGGYPGNPIGHEASSLWKINAQTHHIERTIFFPSTQYAARSLIINPTGDTLAFIWKDIYRLSINDSIFPANSWIQAGQRNLYSLWQHPVKNWIIVSDAKNYIAQGDVYIYSFSKQLIHSFQAGIIPSGFCVKN